MIAPACPSGKSIVMIVMIRYFLTSTLTIQLAQPAVSMQVRQLERELGLPLLERVGKRTYTTKAGELLLAHAGRAMQELDRLRWDKPRTPVLDAFLATLDDLRRSLA